MKKTLGVIIAEHRKEKGMTQLELAEKMGVTDKAVSSKKPKEVMDILFKAVALAMGIAVIVLSVLDALPVESGITLLGIGMTCIGISLLNNKE